MSIESAQERYMKRLAGRTKTAKKSTKKIAKLEKDFIALTSNRKELGDYNPVLYTPKRKHNFTGLPTDKKINKNTRHEIKTGKHDPIISNLQKD